MGCREKSENRNSTGRNNTWSETTNLLHCKFNSIFDFSVNRQRTIWKCLPAYKVQSICVYVCVAGDRIIIEYSRCECNARPNQAISQPQFTQNGSSDYIRSITNVFQLKLFWRSDFHRSQCAIWVGELMVLEIEILLCTHTHTLGQGNILLNFFSLALHTSMVGYTCILMDTICFSWYNHISFEANYFQASVLDIGSSWWSEQMLLTWVAISGAERQRNGGRSRRR